MPAKSKAQVRKLFALANRGEISKEKAEEFAHKSKGKKLPEYVRGKPGASADHVDTSKSKRY